jgi:deltex-like protein
MLGCSHKYHKKCLLAMIGEKQWAKCPICSTIFGHMTGEQPEGQMTHHVDKNLKCNGYPPGTIVINYRFNNGVRNGKPYSGTSRTAYLPNNDDGREVFELLREAFNRRLVFTVGRSVTTGLDNQVVWNGIHHKTNTSGGAASFGYPDPGYFTRVKEELAAKGVVVAKK